MKDEEQIHPFPPVYDENSRILILGSFPSVASRQAGFYYGHPQNRFWRVIAAVTGEEPPRDIPEKLALLKKHGIALWDSVHSCRIEGSADASIRGAAPNDIPALLNKTHIGRIFCNGKTAWNCYNKFVLSQTGIKAEALPSTSAANASWSLERLIEAWSAIAHED